MSSHWDEIPGHPVEDWRAEVANDDTRLGYHEWVAHRAEADPDSYCRTCYVPYDGCGDGYDGECPECADRTEEKRLQEEGGCGDDDDEGCPPRPPSEPYATPLPLSGPRHTKDGVRYQITVTSQQAGVLVLACDAFLRLRLGQVHTCLQEHLPWSGNFIERRNTALREAVQSLSPYLRDNINGYSSSYGVTSPNLCKHAKVAADIHEVIRHRMAWDSLPEGEQPGPFVHYDSPMHWGEEPLAIITQITE